MTDVNVSAEKEIITERTSNGYWNYYGERYKEPLKFTVQFVRNNFCSFNRDEKVIIYRWLTNNEKYNPFFFNSGEYEGIILNAKVTAIKDLNINGTIGMEVSFICNSPFGYSPIIKKSFQINSPGEIISIQDNSEEIGYIYPHMIINLFTDSTLEILNLKENRLFKITGCKNGETLTIDNKNKLISSSNYVHNNEIYDSFNFNWLYLCNRLYDPINKFKINIPCNISMEYKETRKVAIS